MATEQEQQQDIFYEGWLDEHLAARIREYREDPSRVPLLTGERASVDLHALLLSQG